MSRPALEVEFRDAAYADLAELDWSGGAEHLNALARALEAREIDEVGVVVGALGNGRLVAVGAVDYRHEPDVGELWMLSVHDLLQSLGLGTALIHELEDRCRRRRRRRARLRVEHDNPDAARLYRRLGYTEVGSAVDSWPVAGGRTYVTVCTVLERRL